jgi:hypothetical protein
MLFSVYILKQDEDDQLSEMKFMKVLRWLISSVLVVSSLFIMGLELTGENLGHSVNPPFTSIAIPVLIIFGISFILRL